jgi:serine/threonine protein kinase, bacterial
MPLADGATFAGYTIVRMLGAGGMGEVYLAQHPWLPRREALKVLPASVSADAEYRQRFNREADIAATLWHPHIVTAVAEALDYAHQRDLLHREVRPANILLARPESGDQTTAPIEEPLPIEEESPVRVCMQQTGRTRLQCREEIRRSNLGLP